jgi:hypothetical protein
MLKLEGRINLLLHKNKTATGAFMLYEKAVTLVTVFV